MNEAELRRSQEVLGQGLARARMGEDKDLANFVRDVGERFVRQFFGCLRMTKIHALNNKAFDKPIGEICSLMVALQDKLGAVHLVAVEDQVYLNDIRIRLDESGHAGDIAPEMFRHEVGGLTWHENPSVDMWKALIDSFAEDPPERGARWAMASRLEKAGMRGIEVFGIFRHRMSGEKLLDEDVGSRDVGDRATLLISATWTNLSNNRQPNPVPLRRVVTEILELGPGQEGFWQRPVRSTPYSWHTLKVCLVGLLVADEVGMTDEDMQDLGVTSLFHDVGYAAREGAQGAFEGVAPPFERHGGASARMLLRQRGFHEAKIRRALAVVQHHRDHDGERGVPFLFARVIRVVDDYDTLCEVRGKGLSPHEALARIQAGAGTRYDGALVQGLINVMGKYPPETLMELDDGRTVCSVSIARSRDTWDRPLCVVVKDAEGEVVDARIDVDLALEGGVSRVVRPRRRREES
jgi:hypothetical protein